MKKIISIILTVAIVFSALFGLSASAQAADINEDLIKEHTAQLIELVKKEGKRGSSGNLNLGKKITINNSEFDLFIQYMEEKNCLHFCAIEFDKETTYADLSAVTFNYYAPVSKTADIFILEQFATGTISTFTAETTLDMRTYDRETIYPYTLTAVDSSYFNENTIQDLCNAKVATAITALGLLFIKQLDFGMEGLGFTNLCMSHEYAYDKKEPTATTLGYFTQYCRCCGSDYEKEYDAPTGKLKLQCKARSVAAQTVTWNKVKTATGYQVQISTKDGKDWDKYYTLKAGVTNYTFKKLAAGSAYNFRVRFFIEAPDGKDYYSPWSKTLASPTLPAGTTITKLTPASKAFIAQWKKNATVNGYQIQYGMKSNFSGAKTLTVKNAKILKAAVKKLSAKKTYYVRIRTYNTVGKTSYYSAWSKAYKVKTK